MPVTTRYLFCFIQLITIHGQKEDSCKASTDLSTYAKVCKWLVIHNKYKPADIQPVYGTLSDRSWTSMLGKLQPTDPRSVLPANGGNLPPQSEHSSSVVEIAILTLDS